MMKIIVRMLFFMQPRFYSNDDDQPKMMKIMIRMLLYI